MPCCIGNIQQNKEYYKEELEIVLEQEGSFHKDDLKVLVKYIDHINTKQLVVDDFTFKEKSIKLYKIKLIDRFGVNRSFFNGLFIFIKNKYPSINLTDKLKDLNEIFNFLN